MLNVNYYGFRIGNDDSSYPGMAVQLCVQAYWDITTPFIQKKYSQKLMA